MENKLFLVKISDPRHGRQCDLYPFGSIHKVYMDGSIMKTESGSDAINFPTQKVTGPSVINRCQSCENNFGLNHKFISTEGVRMCLRCYERKYLPSNRDEYRELVFEEFKQLKP